MSPDLMRIILAEVIVGQCFREIVARIESRAFEISDLGYSGGFAASDTC